MNTEGKRCSKCGTEHPRTAEYFSLSKRGRDGLGSRCLSCKLEARRASWRRYTKTPKGRASSRRAKRAHVMTPREREARLERDRRYRKTPKGREARLRYYEANAEKLCAASRARAAANPERVRETYRAWRTANPERVRAHNAARRARELLATPPWARFQDLVDVEESRWTFAAMHGLDEHEVHLDHLVPLKAFARLDGRRVHVASGLHCPDNLAWKVGPENLKKNASIAHYESELMEPPSFEQVAFVAGEDEPLPETDEWVDALAL